MSTILNRFWDLKKQLVCATLDLNANCESYGESDRGSGLNDGQYEILNGQLIAVLSSQGKNFLSLGGKLIMLDSNIEIKYHIAQFEDKESWFKVYNKSDLIFEITYINPHKPFILPDPFAYDEDYNTTNFANHLAGYIGQVRENPDIILFLPFGTGCT